VMAPPIARPVGHDDSAFVVSVSGGKDSTATVLAMREAGIACRYVFADTQWEAPETYEYLATLERLLGIAIDRVAAPLGMADMIREGARFPSHQQRWCTRELKVRPLRAYHDAIADAEGVETVSVVGVRADESAERAALAEFLFEDVWGGYVWRPIHRWSVEDVLAIHHRYGVPVNPLYRLGFGRVGCLPCIHADKAAIRLTAEHYPARIAELRELEAHATASRVARNAIEPGHFDDETATFFRERVEVDGKERKVPCPVDRAVAWSRTARGGVQLHLVQPPPDSGCFRWGLCDPPATGTEGGR
jgi:3'-phosphoadenosine 5'-phosphosulfate sulfotransferase (PAPS reductase)/FAD synthetase